MNGLQLGANYTEENEVSGYYDVWSTDKPTTRYHYEGQMPYGEDFTYKEAGVDRQRTTVYVPGLRGTDGVRVTLDGAETAVGWPLYDTHGNNVGMVRQAAGTGFTLGDERRYDAWGAAVWTSGDPPAQGYCGSLGHRSDGESSLVYMRARYYEPWNGRFVSEDVARHDWNWYVYCGNEPVNRIDYSGQEWTWDTRIYHSLLFVLGVREYFEGIRYARSAQGPSIVHYNTVMARAKVKMRSAVFFFAVSFILGDINDELEKGIDLAMTTVFGGVIDRMINAMHRGKHNTAVMAVGLYGLIVLGALIAEMFATDN